MSKTKLRGLEGLTKEVNNTLMLYKKNCTKEIHEVAKEVAVKTVDKLKISGGYEDISGDYRKAITSKDYEHYTYSGATVHVKPPHYRLTHLLEFGHIKADGTGRTRAFPHWKKAEESATKEFEERLRERIGDIEV